MTRLQVEVADFHHAASTMRHDVAESVRICLQGVSLRGELVGEDPAGESWSAAYDPAARTVLRTTAQLSNAAAKTSLLNPAEWQTFSELAREVRLEPERFSWLRAEPS